MYIYLAHDGAPIFLPTAVKAATNGGYLSFTDEGGHVVAELQAADVLFYSLRDEYAVIADLEEDDI